MNAVISAVICTHNRAEYLAEAIQSLVDQRTFRHKYEILVVDNCSTDSTREVVMQFAREGNVAYIHEPTLGLSHARNAGWRAAQGEYVAYLDDDAVACPEWLDRILAVFQSVVPRPGCVGGKTEALWEAERPMWLSDQLITGLTVIDWTDKPHVIRDLSTEWLVGANIAFPVEVLKRVGGFTSGLDRAGKKLLSSGDVFLERQIQKAGYTCFYHPEIVVGHHVQEQRLRKRWFVSRYYWQGVSDAAMQLLEETPSVMGQTRLAVPVALDLLRSPQKLMSFIMPDSAPEAFTRKCFTLIKIGHIAGLLGAARP